MLLDSSVNVDVSHCFIMDIQVPPVPNQPKTFRFPQRTFGVKKPEQKSFQLLWFDRRSWLHCDESKDLAFCHFCMLAYSWLVVFGFNTTLTAKVMAVGDAYVFPGFLTPVLTQLSFQSHRLLSHMLLQR